MLMLIGRVTEIALKAIRIFKMPSSESYLRNIYSKLVKFSSLHVDYSEKKPTPETQKGIERKRGK